MNLKPSLKIRSASATLVGEALRTGQPFELAFSKNQDVRIMGARDRAFVHNLVLTTLRRLGQIDQQIDNCLERPLPKNARRIKDILRIGACQLFFLHIADHGAVDTSVELARQEGYLAHINLVNAVLRRLIKERHTVLTSNAFQINTPGWLWQTWLKTYGIERCQKIAAAHLEGGELDLSVIKDPATLAKVLDGRILPSGTVRVSTRGRIPELPGFREGKWWVQDVAARLVANLAGRVVGKSIVDLCAAPGGKTAFFSAAGGILTAVDRSATRLLRLKENLKRLHLNADVIEEDAIHWRPKELADIVMLDAPCSATGTVRRHPDILWTKSELDIKRLAAVQSEMLNAAAEMVAQNGLLIFATCSLQQEEGYDHITPFLADNPNFRLVPIKRAEVFGIDEVISNPGVLRTLPYHLSEHGGMDGFFAARFRRQM